MELKKSYKGFVFWMIGYILVMLAMAFLPVDAELAMRICLNVCIMAVALLTYIIYRTEYVYWYNGVSYEDAVKAGSLRRREYAGKVFKRFSIGSDICLVYSLFAQTMGYNQLIDVAVFMVVIVAVAISTVGMEL